MMSNIDYSALINDDEVVEDTPRVMSLSRAASDWKQVSGFKHYKGGSLGTDYNLYDEDYSVIDKKKNIQLNQNQATLQNESFGQFIPFKIERYRDGIDLTEASKIVVNYIRPTETAIKQESVVNVEYNESTNEMRFGWLVSSVATEIEGDLEFSIEFGGRIYENSTPLSYTIRTASNKLQVRKTIDAGTAITLPEGWDTEVVDTIVERIATTEVVKELANNYYNKDDIDDMFDGVEQPDLTPYVTNASFSIDDNYNLTMTLVTAGGNKTASIDLPLESLIVNGEYVSDGKKIVLTLKDSGKKVEIPVGDIIAGLATTANLNEAKEALELKITTELANYYTKTEIDASLTTISNKFGELKRGETEYDTVKEYVDSIDISDRLGDLGKITPEGEDERDKTVVEYVSGITGDLGGKTVKSYVDDLDIEGKLTEYTKTADAEKYVEDRLDVGELTVKQYVSAALETVEVDLSGYYTKAEIKTKIGEMVNGDGEEVSVKEYIDANAGSNAASNFYKATYGKTDVNGQSKDNIFTLWKADQDFDPAQPGEVTPVVASQFEIVGGGGGGGSFSKLYIYYDTTADGKLLQNYVFTEEDVAKKQAIIKYSFDGKNATETAPVPFAEAEWKYRLGNTGSWKTIKLETIYPTIPGEKAEFNITDMLTENATYQFQLVVSDASGASVTTSWTVRRTEFKITADTFSDKRTYPIRDISFEYVANGAGIEKTIHFIWDGKRLPVSTTSTSGKVSYKTLPISEILPVQARHGAHLLEVYMTAKVNGVDLESNHIYKDVVMIDPAKTVPVIGCAPRTYTTQQYSTVNVDIYVYDPTTEKPTISISVDDNEEEEKLVEDNIYPLSFKSSEVKDHTIKIVRDNKISSVLAEKTITITVEELPYDIAPVEGAVIDFDPVGKNNSDRIQTQNGWKVWDNGVYSLVTSKNFDWINGGYQTEKDLDGKTIPGSEHFLIKAGTYAVLDYKFFGGEVGKGTGELDPKKTGKDFKIIFKATNIEKTDAQILSCVTNTNGKVGMEMFAHEGYVYGKANSLHLPYSEDDIIEYGFKITKEDSSTPIVMGYEDGVTTSAMVYKNDYKFVQDLEDRQNIKLGSDYCDLLIYKLKIYEKELTDEQILNNFYADARTGEEMVDRYRRNQIYDDEENLTPEELSKKCPWLRVITISAPHFTEGKKYPVGGCTIEYRYVDGAKENSATYWKCEDAVHIGQGTSSDLYGAAARNIDIVLKQYTKDGVLYNPNVKLIVGEGDAAEEKSKVALSYKSIPNNYFNIKVNVASSENANNALLQSRYNKFNPYQRPFVAGQKVTSIDAQGKTITVSPKDTMEFFNCVVFLQETDENLSNHKEFNDTNVHFYSIGNIGDSKKTDKSRLTDPSDDYECCLEIKDVSLPLSDFPTNTIVNAMKRDDKGELVFATKKNLPLLRELINGEYVYTSDTEIDPTKTYYIDGREAESFDGKFSYEWRYIKEYKAENFTDDANGQTAEQKADAKNKEISDVCAEIWWNFYDFITRDLNTDGKLDQDKIKTWKEEFSDYFVLNSALYYYLFTERYTLVDNRAKNSFWHFGKTGTYRRVKEPKEKLLPIYCELIDGTYQLTSDTEIVENKTYYCQHAFDLSWGYDMDTALGTDNDGDMVYRYGYEDTDVDSLGVEIFRESDSTFFCRVRDNFDTELAQLYRTLNSAWGAEDLISQFDNWQSEFPEELWRKDIERKYIRTYNGKSIDGSKPQSGDPKYLDNMANGKKKYQRRQFERNQEKYFASKYRSSTAASDKTQIRLRTARLPVGDPSYAVPPNYNFTLTPYAYMYLTVDHGAGGVSRVRVTELLDAEGKNKTYTLPFYGDVGQDFINIDSAHWIQSVGDLSPIYAKQVTVSAAEKLKELIVGSHEIKDYGDGDYDTYYNEFLQVFKADDNVLLEKINLENVGLADSIDTSMLGKLAEFYANGSAITGFTGANGGPLRILQLPAIYSLKLQNLSNLTTENLVLDTSNLDTLNIENCPGVNWIEIINQSPQLKNFRLTGVDWTLENADLLERIYNMADPDGLGNSQLLGKVCVATIKTQDLAKYNERWKDLEISYGSEITQFHVRFENPDGTEWEELSSWVAINTPAQEPTFIPTQESTAEYDYEFEYWVKKGTNTKYNFSSLIGGDLVLVAKYKAITRTYKIRYISKGATLLEVDSAPYGSYVSYDGPTPTYVLEESANSFYLFSGWDKSGYVTMDKDINAVFEHCAATENLFAQTPLNELRPVDIYALTKLSKTTYPTIIQDNYESDDYIELPMGEIYENYTDLNSTTFIEAVAEYDGAPSSYYDSKEKLFEKDEDFVFAIDYTMAPQKIEDNYTSGVLCSALGQGWGFQLKRLGAGQFITIGQQQILLTNGAEREMLVISHKKGQDGATIYFSNKNGEAFEETVTGETFAAHSISLTFGAEQRGAGYGANARGEVHWAKLFRGQLSVEECRKLASWTHESIKMFPCFSGNGTNIISEIYEISDSATNEYTSLTFMSEFVLDKTLKFNTDYFQPHWENSEPRSYLNNNFYTGIRNSWKQLLKNVKLYTLNKDGTQQITSDVLFLPSIRNLFQDSYDIYAIEGGSLNKFPTNSQRVAKNSKGESVEYWTRSNQQTTGGNNKVCYYIKTDGTATNDYADEVLRSIRFMLSM